MVEGNARGLLLAQADVRSKEMPHSAHSVPPRSSVMSARQRPRHHKPLNLKPCTLNPIPSVSARAASAAHNYGRDTSINVSSNYTITSIVVSIPACHAGDPGSIPGGGVFAIAAF